MKNYYRIMLGRGSEHAAACFEGNFIGADFGVHQDLTGKLPDNWPAFNKEFIPIFLDQHPAKSRVAAGLACGAVWTVSKGIAVGEVVLCPDGLGSYRVGELTGEYAYAAGELLPHRRPVRWLDQAIRREEMSTSLQNSTGSIGTHCMITKYAHEIEQLLGDVQLSTLVTTDETVEDPVAFAMEKHLEAFSVKNWARTELGQQYDILEEDGELLGQQYQTDTGPLDILAVSKDKKTLLVVELKRGRASDVVVGQVLRYMGYVTEVLADPEQTVRGNYCARGRPAARSRC